MIHFIFSPFNESEQEPVLRGLPLIYLVIIVIAFFHIKMIIYKTK